MPIKSEKAFFERVDLLESSPRFEKVSALMKEWIGKGFFEKPSYKYPLIDTIGRVLYNHIHNIKG